MHIIMRLGNCLGSCDGYREQLTATVTKHLKTFCVSRSHVICSVKRSDCCDLVNRRLESQGLNERGLKVAVIERHSVTTDCRCSNQLFHPASTDNMIFHQCRFHFDSVRFPLCNYHLLVTFGY